MNHQKINILITKMTSPHKDLIQSNTIKFYKREVYGQNRLYIDNPTIAEKISVLTRQKTISEKQINILQSLGIKFEKIIK